MLKTVTNSINASQIQTPITLPGDVTLSTGNLVIGTSGKGIDFSATAGTGTSELLADYEEGTWTPNQGAGLVVVGAFSSTGRYTKIGRQVTVIGKVSGATSISVGASGIISTNLPFTSAAETIGIATNDNLTVSGGTYVGAATILYATVAIGASTGILFQITYTV